MDTIVSPDPRRQAHRAGAVRPLRAALGQHAADGRLVHDGARHARREAQRLHLLFDLRRRASSAGDREHRGPAGARSQELGPGARRLHLPQCRRAAVDLPSPEEGRASSPTGRSITGRRCRCTITIPTATRSSCRSIASRPRRRPRPTSQTNVLPAKSDRHQFRSRGAGRRLQAGASEAELLRQPAGPAASPRPWPVTVLPPARSLEVAAGRRGHRTRSRCS